MRQGRPVDHDIDRPVYKQVADDIREQIADGGLSPDERLPGEERLGHIYGVGVNTIRNAMALLRSEGLLVTEKGRGSRVRPDRRRAVAKLPRKGRAFVRRATAEESERLGLGEGEPVIVIVVGGEEQVLPAFEVELVNGEGDETPRDSH
ncbi:GntR family transcriptional regulator [Thermomonospora umbrina]|uniref:Regulatory GntR family protein n=1 Tax=Thermomonospora umbrina TaxID=111806 RepID=A0A3D9T1U7_9ACTN|nr:GntR family transcriptional regulator [Thermomonospora umbrina]REF00304.1 regulatory GntR family protein [Thermomonospora umbrina]